MDITSAAFKEGSPIPPKYTCDGVNISPPLAWHGAPTDTRTFALIVHDPDAPVGDWVHWLLFNMPASLNELPDHIPPLDKLLNGASQGRNDFKKIGYGGPCPPGGTHRYYFRLYALDTILAARPGCTRADLERAMRGHILAEASLMGTYHRK